MSVAMWNCHSWPLDVSNDVKLLGFQPLGCQFVTLSFLRVMYEIAFLTTRLYNVKLLFLTTRLSVMMWNCHSWPRDVKQWAPITIPENYMCMLHLKLYICWPARCQLAMWNCHSWPLDVSNAMWNGHSWPLDVSSNVKLPFLTTRCQ